MGKRRLCIGAAVASLLLLTQSASAATFTTTNFVVTAATPELARQFGEAAEHWRIVKAKEWLGQEMPNWPQRCPLRVEISNEGPSGATTFDFQQTPLYQFMQIKGPKERLLNSVLPHEVTHTVFAYYFHQPVPRWADEGGAVLSEDDLERGRHDQMCRQLLNAGHAFTLKHLFNLHDYPRDMMVLYAEGFSVSRFLVDSKDRPTFLHFVEQGMKQGWDRSVQANYGYHNVNDLEAAWIDSLRKPRSVAIASNTREGSARGSSAELTSQSTVRTTSPPSLPELGPPMIRGSSANLGTDGERFSGNSKPAPLPNSPAPEPVPTSAASSAPLPPLPPPIPLPSEPVRLGTPSLGLLPK
ncbi:MAG TPA: hypothetical protein VGZ47_15305 [Gemmataceae bacterium]|nr:hypothetical protein [Gemmataceae bacterium]